MTSNGRGNGNGQHEDEPITEDHAMINDVNIGYCRYGHGSINILAIPGGVGCYAKDWPAHALRSFDPSLVTIIAFDPPGYGKSRPPDRKQEVNRCLKDAPFGIKLMQHLNLTPFTVIGWSEGGRTAIHVTGQGKALVKHMVLVSTSSRIDMRGAGAFKGMRNSDQWLPDAREVYLKFYDEAFFRKQWADLCDVVNQVYSDLGGRFPSDYVLPQIKQPALIVYGGQDRFVLDPKLMGNQLAKHRIATHAIGGHDLHIKHAGWFAENVMKFIADADANKKL